MNFYKKLALAMFPVMVLGYNNCGQVKFNPTAASQSAPGSTGTVSPATCSSTAFGSTCNGEPATPPNSGAHGYFYGLTPIPDSNALDGVAGSMSLFTPQDLIPNFSLYTTDINVPLQSWTVGFPGYATLQQWFGVCYDGAWTAPTTGSYTFVTAVDDAVAIWIDGNLIGENDDGNISSTVIAKNTGANYTPNPVAFSPVTLTQGPHSVEIMYYQGWPTQLEEQIWVLPPGANFTANSTPPTSDFMQLSSPINGVLNCPH